MPVSDVPISLDNACTAVHDNVLYAYSADGFASLPLKENAKWKKLAHGVKVTGQPSCIGTNTADPSQAAFYVIGGKTDSADYSGVQKYMFSTGKWKTISMPTPDMKNRQWHSTAFLRGENSIVVYAGKQNDAKGTSSQTFTIKASEPHTLDGYPSIAPPSIAPVLLPWGDGDVALIGPDTADGKVFLFNSGATWRDIGTSLAKPFPADSSAIRSALISGSDGSKSLYTFNLSQSPNTAQRIVILGAGGKPIAKAAPVGRRSIRGSSMSQQRRALTVDDWPKYNAKNAPKLTRSDYSVAQGADGMVVFTGGNAKEPVALFDANKNKWLDAKVFLSDGTQKILDTSSTSTSMTSTTTSASSTTQSTISTDFSSTTEASTTAEPTSTSMISGSSSPHHGPSSNTILGVTLGSIAAFLVLLGLILLCLRRHKRRKNRAVGDDINPDEKDTVAFAKSTQPSASPAHYRGHNPQLSQESYSSVAILMNKMGRSGSNAGYNDSFRESIDSVHHKQFKSTISKPIPQQTANPMLQGSDDKGVAFAPSVAPPRLRTNAPTEPKDGTRRSSGWNKYWSGGSALQILGYGSGKRNTVTSERSSRYSQTPSNSNNPRITQDSATVPPLNFEGRPAMNSVISGSPVVSQHTSKMPFTDGMAGTIEDRPVSPVSSGGYSSGIPESINDAWDPTESGKPWGTERAPSSAYAPSVQFGTSLGPSNGGAPATTNGASVSNQPHLAMSSTTNDMSWLNLGDQSHK